MLFFPKKKVPWCLYLCFLHVCASSISFPSSPFLSSFLSYSLLLYSLPPPLLACSNFYLIWQKKTKTKNHTKTPCFGVRGWGVEEGKSFRAASSNQSNGFWESEGHKNRGNFSRKICAMLFREKMEINFFVKNWQSMSWLFSFDKFQALYDVKQLWGDWENQDKCCTINTRIISWTNVDNNVDKHVAHLTNNPFVNCHQMRDKKVIKFRSDKK